MRAIAVFVGLLALSSATPGLADQVTEDKSPLIIRWEAFQAKNGIRNDSACSIGEIDGFRIVFTPETGLDPAQDRDCKKVYK